MLSFFFLLFFSFLSFLLSFFLFHPFRSIFDKKRRVRSIRFRYLSNYRLFLLLLFSMHTILFFFYICSGQPRFASTRKNLLVLQRKRGIKDWYLLYIYVKSYFSREIRGLRCTYRIVFLSFSSSLSFFLVQLHVRYHGCIKIFNFIQTDAAIRF